MEEIRHSEEYNLWRLEVYKKDDYTCQACKTRKQGDNITLHAHHIISFSNLVEKMIKDFLIKTLVLHCAVSAIILRNLDHSIINTARMM